ncbi:MAG: NHL repeat-containing protein [Puia sp.]
MDIPQHKRSVVAGGNGFGNAPDQFDHPVGIFVDHNSNLYVADLDNHRVQKFALGSTVGVTVAGGNGPGFAANQLQFPTAVFVDEAGNVYVVDDGNHRVQKWAPGATSGVTVAGGNGPGAAANQLQYPYGLYVDGFGNIFIGDATKQPDSGMDTRRYHRYHRSGVAMVWARAPVNSMIRGSFGWMQTVISTFRMT